MGAWRAGAAGLMDGTGKLSPKQVAVGQRAQVTVVVSGTTTSAQPEFLDVEDLDVLYVGPTTQFSSLNGSVTRNVSYRYLASANKPGRYRLGPFLVRVGSDTLASEPVELEVLAQARPGGTAGVAAGVANMRVISTSAESPGATSVRAGGSAARNRRP